MCSGDLGAGVSYLAVIKIDGNLDQQALTALHNQIKQLIQAQNGRVVIHTRASTAADTQLNVVPKFHGGGVP
jgi:hypothetical protein